MTSSAREMVEVPINATPNKRIYRSIVHDYVLETAICELVDNSIDVWSISSGGPDLEIFIDIDIDQQKITVKDNAGGVKEKDLRNLVSPGETNLTGSDETIGIFGVGSKRSVVALSEFIRITTRYRSEKTCRIEYDEEWLNNPSWEISYSYVSAAPPSSTEIILSNLRFRIEEEDLQELRNHLAATYAYFFETGNVSISLNEDPISAQFFDNWSYPPEFMPRKFVRRLSPKKGRKKIRFEITSGLIIEKGKTVDYGVYIYCNKRLIVKALKSPEVGFMTGLAGQPDNRMSLARIIVKLDGPSNDMPWTSNKADIHYNHFVFQAIKKDIVQAVKVFAKLSRRLYPDFEEEVLPFKTGDIEVESVKKDKPIRQNRYPAVPKRTVHYKETVFELNKDLAEVKPWIRGLYEGIVGEEMISRQRILTQRNRLSLLLLDGILEIALKNFLAFEIDPPIGGAKLSKLKRSEVHAEVKSRLLTGDTIWQRISFFYEMRCELAHRKADFPVPDRDIEVFRADVITILRVAFDIKFPIKE